MRAFPLLALLLLPTVAMAQTGQDNAGQNDDNSARMAGDLEPAPVPAVLPPRPSDRGPATVPEQMSPSGIGNNIAGPANATPFSSTPAAPDTAPPNGRAGTQGGGDGVVPAMSK